MIYFKLVNSLKYFFLIACILLLCDCSNALAQKQSNQSAAIFNIDEKFKPVFTILYRTDDPKLTLRASGINGYTIPTWISVNNKNLLQKIERSTSHHGDGFDARVLEGDVDKRTANLYGAAVNIVVRGKVATIQDEVTTWTFPENDLFELKADIVKNKNGELQLSYSFTPKEAGYFSVGYTGAPSYEIEEAEEIWQPMMWQEKRFPKQSYMTLAFRTPLPSCFVQHDNITYGAMAHADEFPFEPLPTDANSRFGIALRNPEGKAQAQFFAPVMGGTESKMEKGKTFDFKLVLIAQRQKITDTYEYLARCYYGFSDYRKNEISSLNQTLERMVEYGNSSFSYFVDSLKGYGYSTDVPGAVKNVSSLNALELALVQDDPKMFWKRAYPMMEYMLSRQKFLFSLDSKQKSQHPSRRLLGPAAPITEIMALYDIFNGNNPFLLQMAKENITKTRIKNLNVAEKEDTWINALFLYKSTKDKEYLDKAIAGADQYLKERVQKRQTDFSDSFGKSFFFWIDYTNRWIELLELYELTKNEKYLNAAQDGARHYALQIWMAPKIPDANVVVNKEGKAPMYWYLKSKGHKQMYSPKTEIPAWRLSEIGLTSESAGTCAGHRGIFMANFAPWMLRLGTYCNDDYLKEIAKAAIIGRYRNFPGYHINTKRTDAYEHKDYPLYAHKSLSVNSFHYNHILPMASMILDYLVTDVWSKSKGKIDFPSTYIEGYAYMKNKFYGHQKGQFYTDKGVQLWMPKQLLDIDHVELNYVAARKGNKLYLAFTNQSDQAINTAIVINPTLVEGLETTSYTEWKNNVLTQENKALNQARLPISVVPKGITAIVVENVSFISELQDQFFQEPKSILDNNQYHSYDFGGAKAMLFKLGNLNSRAFIYLSDDDSQLTSVSLYYKNKNNETVKLSDASYPFEFTIEVDDQIESFNFWFTGINKLGEMIQSNNYSF